MIWKKNYSLKQMNQLSQQSAIEHLGIKFSAQGDDWLEATMPVDQRTVQPMGFLHGGLSVALAETIGSMAGFCCINENQAVLGLDINANHLRPVKEGVVTAKATPVHLGKKIQVWQIHITDQQNKLCCIARLTLSVVDHE
ncbi:hotdog fold thioesterase [Pasteurella canis]|uniref:Esterase n=1 Tax=Pasteurella canis TaxID=753 RepID=A0A379ETE3_9PAST|nr:hotdog fold thioesterase [Pasteurella canis]MXN87873.1 hotdog fold thioesterase [Pasteurella canis]UAY78501.1 hotdog fold thioesterase [Pasteurella canis]UDW84642.1 hotdog fold thioesterase [Pasteurella canis]UEA17694.1 hotdog fold thioesterase [Pasteurella canis]UEC24113.1 hotdog fold thioesterase [Pasteurella canis]